MPSPAGITGRPESDFLGRREEDITEKVSLEGQLRQAQKLEAVGRLAGGVA